MNTFWPHRQTPATLTLRVILSSSGATWHQQERAIQPVTAPKSSAGRISKGFPDCYPISDSPLFDPPTPILVCARGEIVHAFTQFIYLFSE